MSEALPEPPEETGASEAAPAPPAKARWRRRLVGLVLVLVAAPLGGELAVRKLVPPPRPLWTEHPFTLLVHEPGVAVEVPGAGGKPFVYETSALGFRGKSMKDEKRPKDAYRIFFLGDELTEAPDLPEELTFAGLVEAGLDGKRAPDDLRVEVANAAAPGSGLEAVYATFIHRVLPHDPDAVVVQSGVEDVLLALSEGWEDGSLGWRAPPGELPSPGEWLRSVSRLADLAWTKGHALGLVKEAPAPARPFRRLRPLAQGIDWKRTLPAYRRFLHLLGVTCRDAKIDLVLATQPTLLKEVLSPEENARLTPVRLGDGPSWPHDELRRTLETFDEEVRTASAREGCALLDLAKKVPHDLDHFAGGFRLTPKGHAVVARLIEQEVFLDRPAHRR